MKFYYQIRSNRYTKQWESEQTEIDQGSFESPSIQSAKAKLTRIANTTELFSYEQSWDNELKIYTGKQLRWQNWAEAIPGTDKNKKPLFWTLRTSERQSGEKIYDEESPKYGRRIGYTVSLMLYWAAEESQ